MMQNVTIGSNPTVMAIEQAALKYAFVYSPDPTPTPTPTPTSPPIVSPTSTVTTKPIPTKIPAPTATPTATEKIIQSCEVCGMDVTSADQAKYVITDGNGTVHYAECYMCALQLVNKYDNVTITSYCDWYGPNYPVTVESSQYGKVVTVTPSTAMFLNGGSCVINRVAYNQTAADALLTNGFSVYTLPSQQYALPSSTSMATVKNAALALAVNDVKPNATLPILLAVIGGVAIIALSTFAFKKFKINKD
jgi:hypothetical protein